MRERERARERQRKMCSAIQRLKAPHARVEVPIINPLKMFRRQIKFKINLKLVKQF